MGGHLAQQLVAGLVAWLGLGLRARRLERAAVGLLLLGAALLDRRRRDLDPRLRERRLALDRARRRLREAANRAPETALEEVADALRRMRAELPEVPAPEIESFLAECDALRFAPAAGGADTELLARATALVAEFSERAR